MALLLAAAALFAPAAQAQIMNVWLDVDPAAGLPDADVDDALALIQAFHSPELRVRGVSVVYGNAPLADGLPIAREVVEKFGPAGLGVYAGAAGPDALGTACDSTDAMAEAFKGMPMTLLALGPLTNVGSFLKLHPGLHDRIAHIVVVAGRRPGQRITPNPALEANFRDFNFENDPEAMRIILESKVPLVMAPWEVSSHVWVTAADIESLRGKSAAGTWIAEHSQLWLGLWRDSFERDGFNPFDTLAIGWATHPKQIKILPVTVSIQPGPDDTREPDGPPAEKPYLLVDPDNRAGRAATYCYLPDESFKPMLLERLAGPPQAGGAPGQ